MVEQNDSVHFIKKSSVKLWNYYKETIQSYKVITKTNFSMKIKVWKVRIRYSNYNKESVLFIPTDELVESELNMAMYGATPD